MKTILSFFGLLFSIFILSFVMYLFDSYDLVDINKATRGDNIELYKGVSVKCQLTKESTEFLELEKKLNNLKFKKN